MGPLIALPIALAVKWKKSRRPILVVLEEGEEMSIKNRSISHVLYLSLIHI